MPKILETVETHYDGDEKPYYRRVLGKLVLTGPVYPLNVHGVQIGPPPEAGWVRTVLAVALTPLPNGDQGLDYEYTDSRLDQNPEPDPVPTVVTK